MWQKFKLIAADPLAFWNTIKDEQGIGQAFKYLCTLFLINILISVFYFLIFYKFSLISKKDLDAINELVAQLHVGFFIAGFLVGLVIAAVVGLCMSFVFVAIKHLFIKIFGGQGNFAKTYQIYSYSMSFSVLAALVPPLGFFMLMFAFALQVIGVSKLHRISPWKAFFALFIPYCVFGLIFIVVFFVLLIALISSHSSSPSTSGTGNQAGFAFTDPQGVFQFDIPIGWQVVSATGTRAALVAFDQGASFSVEAASSTPNATLQAIQTSDMKRGVTDIYSTLGGENDLSGSTVQDGYSEAFTLSIHEGALYVTTFTTSSRQPVSNLDLSGYSAIINSFEYLK